MKFILTACSILISSPLIANTTAFSAGPEPVLTTTTDSGWRLTLGLYGWGAGLDGDLGVAGFSAPVDLSFSDIFETLTMTAMGMVEVQKGPWIFQLEGLYLQNAIKVNATTPLLAIPVQAKLTADTTRLEAVAGYRLVETSTTRLDLLAGLVYYDISNELRFIGPFAVRSATAGDSWIDPVIGLRVNQTLSDRWSLNARAEVGGFGVNADLVWQAIALVGYQVNESSTLLAGWRYAAVDYQNGGFLYDVANSGPILALAITW